MASVRINLTGEQLAPSGNVLENSRSIAGDGVFISVNFSADVSVILPGFDAESVNAARLMAAKLTELADEAEAKIARRTIVEAR